MGDIQQWLSELGLPQLAEVLEREQIDWEALLVLSESDLRELGLPIGQRAKLVAALRSLRQADSSSVEKGMDIQTEPQRDGANSGQQAERRHLTVMFCDLVGSTELSQKLDPEALRELMRNYQQCCGAVIDKYDGHVAQYLGDGLMTYFGWPRAHEDDAERAIRAGLEIVEAVKQVPAPELLQVRVGIATGPVVVGETGDGDASVPKLAVGETPNVAARIQGLAGADQVMIGPDTRRLVGNTFALDDSGEHALKGIVDPMRAWCVTGESLAEGRFDAAHGEGLTPLVGRELELGLLMERWQLAQDGEGQVVLLSGEPGIGKSRILSALRERLKSESANAMRFQCSPYYVNSAFWPSIDNFERVLRYARDEAPESKLDKLEALMVEHYQRPLADVRFIASMLSIPCDERYGELAMTPQKFKDETLRTLVDLTEAAAKKQPSVLFFEDLHWADPTTLELLDLAIDRVKAMPLLIVLTHRPEFQNRWTDHGHVIGLNLSKLTRAQSAAMVSRVATGKGLPDDLLERILVKTDGVPLYVEELTKSILESDELDDAGDRYEYAGKSHSVTIPATLRDSLMARLDRFAPVKEIAQIGAAIGREFTYELVSAVAPLTQGRLDEALAQLTGSGLAFRRGTPPEANYTFKHALVQDAAYDSLLKSKLQELHRKIARVIEERFPNIKTTEPEVLAHHLTAAGASGVAIPLWLKAGELALKRMALTEAISHLNKGMQLIDILPASAERDASELQTRALLSLAWEVYRGWQAPQIVEILLPALPLAQRSGDLKVLARTLWGLWVNPLTQGRISESLQWADELLASAQAREDEEMLLVAHMAEMVTHFWLGDLSQANHHGQAILTRYAADRHAKIALEMNHDPKSLVELYAANWEWMQGYPDRAKQTMEELSVHSESIGHPFDRAFGLSLGGMVHHYRGEADRWHELLLKAQAVGRENNMPFVVDVLVPTYASLVFVGYDKPEEAVAFFQSALPVWDATGLRINAYIRAVFGEALAMTGDAEAGLEQIDEMLQQVANPDWFERVFLAEILRLKGWMLTLKDDLAGAEKNYLASIDWAREQQAKSWELRTSTSLARLWQQQGKKKEAHDLLAPVYDWFTEGFGTKDLKEAKALLQELRQEGGG